MKVSKQKDTGMGAEARALVVYHAKIGKLAAAQGERIVQAALREMKRKPLIRRNFEGAP